LDKKLAPEQKKFIEDKIINEVNSLNKDSFIVREKLPIIKKIVSRKFDLNNYIEELKKDIAPLISLNPGKNSEVTSFILQVEKLFGYIIDENIEKIFSVFEYVEEKLNNILQKDNLEVIQNKKDIILTIINETFWEQLTFEDVEFIIKELAPLMVYYEKNPKRMLQVDAPDLVLNVENFKKEVNEDKELKQFLETNLLIKKIRNEEGITPNELLKLEEQLRELRPEITIDNVQRIQKIDFILFLRKILGLKREYDPQVLIEREFDIHILFKNQQYNSEQIKFLQVLKKVFARTKHIELKDFTVPPLSNERPLDKFQTSELQKIVVECNKIKIK
ncbi:MAG: type I restriction-modification enzyme R subunit C-terminal domain-containing protein, partial [Nanoarchaeota archaeon]